MIYVKKHKDINYEKNKMAKLRDMEELIEEIVDVNMKSYMREALTCYMTDAYRACIVLSFIAIFEDIYSKLDGLAKTNSTARDIYNQIKKQRDEQKVFESDLLNKLKSAQIISELDADFLEILRNLRNKAAHPSGHKPTAEEARYVFAETIDRFLAKPVLSTTQVADQILKKLSHAYVFPTVYITDHAKIVNLDVKTLHEDGYHYLISKLLIAFSEVNEQTKINARRYILGLTFNPLNDKVLEQIKKQVIEAGSTDESNRDLLMSCISANYNTLFGLEKMVYVRLNAMLEHTIKSTTSSDQPNKLTHPVSVLISLVKAGEEIALEHFEDNLKIISNKYKLIEPIIKIASKHFWFKKIIVNSIFLEAGSDQFEIANKFADTVYTYDEGISGLFNEEECFELIVNIFKAAEIGAFSSIRIRDSKFKQIPKIKEKALSKVSDLFNNYEEILKREIPKISNLTDFISLIE